MFSSYVGACYGAQGEYKLSHKIAAMVDLVLSVALITFALIAPHHGIALSLVSQFSMIGVGLLSFTLVASKTVRSVNHSS